MPEEKGIAQELQGGSQLAPVQIHPDDPGPLENYPMGRPPLTPEQTRRAYARQLGIDTSRIDPNGMKLMLDEPRPGQEELVGFGMTATPGIGGGLSQGDPQRVTPDFVIRNGAGPSEESGQPRESRTSWDDAVPLQWAENDHQEKEEESGGEKKPKEAPSPGGTILITSYESGLGWVGHSAIYIRGKGFLYDPGGTFRQTTRGSGGFFDLDENGYQSYIDYHNKAGRVNQTKIPTTPSEEDQIKARAEQQGDASYLMCAIYVSYALGGVCGIAGSSIPRMLQHQAENATREQ